MQLGHEALAEAHDLVLAAALGVEVAAALAGADGHAGESVLEDLLEGEELDDVERDARVEPQAALVGPEGAVELDAEAAVHVHLALVVHPRHAEDDLPLRLADTLYEPVTQVLRVLGHQRPEAAEHLVHRLQEVALPHVAVLDASLDLTEGLPAVLGSESGHGVKRTACGVNSPGIRDLPAEQRPGWNPIAGPRFLPLGSAGARRRTTPEV